jgi:hypothetical protein
VSTFDTDVVPLNERAIATAWMRCPFLKRSGSRNARYGAESSTATRTHGRPGTRVANATVTGTPVTVAVSR